MGWAARLGWPAAHRRRPQRRRALAVGGYTTTAVLSSLIGAATSVWQVGILRAGAWAARGLRVPARNALLADIVAEGLRVGRGPRRERVQAHVRRIGKGIEADASHPRFLMTVRGGFRLAGGQPGCQGLVRCADRRDRG
jgi:hypothetical protein